MPKSHFARLTLALSLVVFGSVTACSAEQDTKIDLIVSGAYVVTLDESNPVIENGAIAIDDGIIIAVGSHSAITDIYSAQEHIDGKDRILMPGLINGHTHTAMTLFRGMADDYDLMTWLQNYIFPMEGQFVDPEFIKIGAELACWEMIRSGTTTFVDMYFYPDVIADVMEQCGLRAILGAPSIDFPSPGFSGWDDSFAASVDFVTRRQGKSSRITPAFAPHAPYTVSPEHYAQLLAAAKKLDAPITTHVSEDRAEVATIKERYDTTSVQLLNKLGLLDHRMIAAHMVWPDGADKQLLINDNVGAVHNPTSNLKTAAGISPVPEMLAMGIHVGLGTDGAASNNDLNMWDEIKMAALLHKGFGADATAMPAPTVLKMATQGGADAIGLGQEVGSIEVGKRADLIQISLESPHMAPIYDVVSHLVYVVNSRDVVTSIVDGQVLMQDGQVLKLDADKVRQAANAKAAEIKAALASH